MKSLNGDPSYPSSNGGTPRAVRTRSAMNTPSWKASASIWGHDFAVAWRHSCQQHADATLRAVRQLASAGFPPSGPGPVGADLALALAALADEFVDQGPVQPPAVIW